MHLDLADFDSIRGFAGEVMEKFPSIFCIVCNAGVAFPMELHKKTDLGLEIHAGINHLGHFLLANLLIDGLADSPPRVVMVASHLASQVRLTATFLLQKTFFFFRQNWILRSLIISRKEDNR